MLGKIQVLVQGNFTSAFLQFTLDTKLILCQLRWARSGKLAVLVGDDKRSR